MVTEAYGSSDGVVVNNVAPVPGYRPPDAEKVNPMRAIPAKTAGLNDPFGIR